METKSSIRKEILALRGQLSKEIRMQNDLAIFNKVSELPCIQQAETILCYAGYQSEVSTKELMQLFLATGKRLYLPRVNGDDMDFYRITKMSDLTEGYKGIPEPSTACMDRYTADGFRQIVMIMPGCAFSRDGSRIGYGKGYYDRYLEKHAIVKRVALCYSLQIADNIPTDTHDKKASIIITEDEVIDCSK